MRVFWPSLVVPFALCCLWPSASWAEGGIRHEQGVPVSFVHFGRCEDTISWLALGAGVLSASQELSTDGTALHVPGLPVLCIPAEPIVAEDVELEGVEDEANDELEGPGGEHGLEDFEGVEGLEDVDLVDEGPNDYWDPGLELWEQELADDSHMYPLPVPPSPTNCPCSLRRSSPLSTPLSLLLLGLLLGVWSLRRRG